MDHFDKYPLITQKKADFEVFKQAVDLVKSKKHLTKEGLQKIVNISWGPPKPPILSWDKGDPNLAGNLIRPG